MLGDSSGLGGMDGNITGSGTTLPGGGTTKAILILLSALGLFFLALVALS